MITASVLLNFLIVFGLMWIMRQVDMACDKAALVFRIIFGVIAIPFIIKMAERVHQNDAPTFFDLIQDGSVLFLLLTIIIFNKNRYSRL